MSKGYDVPKQFDKKVFRKTADRVNIKNRKLPKRGGRRL